MGQRTLNQIFSKRFVANMDYCLYNLLEAAAEAVDGGLYALEKIRIDRED